ncbi:hypothetical protein SpCBS45565_g07999 [Spizellomyces sp. 'palustris']|nr:hypothetical protein SpCBS45565_g07999 [Spizellomyces sp. 'palustris']
MAHPTLLRLGNTIVYLFFLSSSIYNVVGPDGTDIGYGKHPTYLTPAPFAFAIWGLIHTLFLGFVIWQWLGDSEEIVVEAYGSYFIIAGLLTSLWHNNWESGHLILSLLILLFASASITIVYHNLRNIPPRTYAQSLFVHAPISLYHGWLVFVTWLNIFAIFTTIHDPAHPPLLHRVLVFLVLLQLTGTAVAYTEFKNRDVGDIPGAFTIAWALFGVAAGQQSKFISISALVMGIIVLLYAFRPQVIKRRIGGGERQPLLGSAAPDEQV